MSAIIAPPPLSTDVSEKGGTITQNWADWITLSLVRRLQAAVSTLSHPVDPGSTTTVDSSSASIGVTSFPLSTVNAGMYRVGWAARVTTAAGISSSLTVSVAYTRLGVSCVQTSAAMTSNATNQPASGSFILHADGGAPITWSTTYGSSGAPAMVYELDMTCENVA